VKPPFIRVVPDEIERFGPAAAIVLAHIRYRCESDGPMRIQREGRMWWRVSRAGLGREVGMSLKVVRKALNDLGDAVSAKHFPPLEDQSLAYRAALKSEPLTSQKPCGARSDQPEAPQGQVPSPTGPGTEPHGASALPIETLENWGEAVVDGHPTSSVRSANGNQPRPRCARHARIVADEDVPSCPACRGVRLKHEAELEAEARERERRRQLIPGCPDCYGTHWLTGDDGEPIAKCDHRNLFIRSAL
jgi:hypothetical protein